MNSFLHLVKRCKNLLTKIKVSETDYIPAAQKVKMTDNHDVVDDSEPPPNKKLCTEDIQTSDKVEKVKAKKVAILLSYLGDKYCGMQLNDPVKTIEGEFLSALSKANLIPLMNVKDKINFQRTARTDKGVSAVKQVVSLKLAENSSVELINKYLPEDIRVLSIKRVTKGFQCQNECSARVYSYTLPTFALAPEFYEEYPESYRICEEIIQKANAVLISYVGTHNFHNFTTRKSFQDPSAKRYIIDFKAGEPFLSEGVEFITLTVKGQSFMLHQIRKMVGHMIAVLKGATPPNIETDIWTSQKFAVPMVPGLGLMLEDVLFSRYNRRYQNDGIHESLAFDELEDEVKSFKKKILSNIIKKEVEEKVMFNWLLKSKDHSYVKEETQLQEDEKTQVEEDDKVTSEAVSN